jgi:hypothetical protein
MKKLFLLALAAMTLSAQADVITLDLTKPVDPTAVTFDENGLWEQRFDGGVNTIDFQIFRFSHYGTTAGYNYCDVFSISKDPNTTYDGNYSTDQWRNVVGHGKAGEGTPFLIAYDGGAYASAPRTVTFKDNLAYAAKEVWICQSAWADRCIQSGSGDARSFVQDDYLTITFRGLDKNGNPIADKEVIYYLADYSNANLTLWTLNSGWEKVDLSALGTVWGISYEMTTTDVGEYGPNTALYFSMDALAVEELASQPTALETLSASEVAEISIYTISGQFMGTVFDAPQNIIRTLPAGSYLLRSADKTMKVIR